MKEVTAGISLSQPVSRIQNITVSGLPECYTFEPFSLKNGTVGPWVQAKDMPVVLAEFMVDNELFTLYATTLKTFSEASRVVQTDGTLGAYGR